jgi:hypothetical protein
MGGVRMAKSDGKYEVGCGGRIGGVGHTVYTSTAMPQLSSLLLAATENKQPRINGLGQMAHCL